MVPCEAFPGVRHVELGQITCLTPLDLTPIRELVPN